MAKRDFPPAPWRHPHPVTRTLETVAQALGELGLNQAVLPPARSTAWSSSSLDFGDDPMPLLSSEPVHRLRVDAWVRLLTSGHISPEVLAAMDRLLGVFQDQERASQTADALYTELRLMIEDVLGASDSVTDCSVQIDVLAYELADAVWKWHQERKSA